MALQKPILESIPAFDATAEKTIKFIVNGGDQVVKNKAIIRLGSTNEVVYNETQTTFNLEHTIPANTLVNGNYYVIQIQTLNQNNDVSVISSPITFYCYSEPSFYFSNLPAQNIINNSTFTFNLAYNQEQGEALSSWEINVYDISRGLLWSSDVNYVGGNGIPPANFNYEVSGFNDASVYFIRATGQTEQQTVLDTGYIVLQTVYDSPSIYSLFSLQNNACDGYIIIDSNVVSLNGTSNPEPPIYIDNSEIDLTEEESYVNWEQSFAIYDTSTARIWLRKMNTDAIIATFYNADKPTQNITLFAREAEENNVNYLYIEGYYVGEDGTTGYIYSNYINKPNQYDQCMIWLQKRNGMYDLKISVLGQIEPPPEPEQNFQYLSELPVGALVQDPNTKFNDEPIVWIVGEHDHYRIGNSVLISQNVLQFMPYDAKELAGGAQYRDDYGNTNYGVSNIDKWLNSDRANGLWWNATHKYDKAPISTNIIGGYNAYDGQSGFLHDFSKGMKEALVGANISYTMPPFENNIMETLNRKVFLPSLAELGGNTSDGTKIAYFENNIVGAYPTTKAVQNAQYQLGEYISTDVMARYWLRTSYSNYVNYIQKENEENLSPYVKVSFDEYSGTMPAIGSTIGVRPMINVVSDIKVSMRPNINGIYTLFLEVGQPESEETAEILNVLNSSQGIDDITQDDIEKLNELVVSEEIVDTFRDINSGKGI